MSQNDITGDEIKTAASNSAYRDGWDRIFKKSVPDLEYSEWEWCVDWCKRQGLSPANTSTWRRAYHARILYKKLLDMSQHANLLRDNHNGIHNMHSATAFIETEAKRVHWCFLSIEVMDKIEAQACKMLEKMRKAAETGQWPK